MSIDYISNFDLSDNSGGWNGINFRLFSALKEKTEIKYHGPVNPPIYYGEKLKSKALRVLSMPGDYFFFSERRLNSVAQITDNLKLEGEELFFFGVTPWVKCRPKVPYSVYLDICFPNYLEIFLAGQKFKKSDIKRISDLESQFLNNAKHIFWGSEWAMKDAEVSFHKMFPASTVISTGGQIEIPSADSNDKIENKLLFISLNFIKKGGLLAFEAFKLLKNQIPDLTMTVIGERPPEEIATFPGINYKGKLDKNKADDVEIFEKELRTSFFLIHPTEMDTMGAVIAEAGYYGLPTIAPDKFGIPDLIRDGKTGLMIKLPLSAMKFSNALLPFFKNKNMYVNMRAETRSFMVKNRSWESIADKILNKL